MLQESGSGEGRTIPHQRGGPRPEEEGGPGCFDFLHCSDFANELVVKSDKWWELYGLVA